MDKEAFALLQRMLTLDPRKRISAADALMVRSTAALCVGGNNSAVLACAPAA